MVAESITNRRAIQRNPEAVALGSLFLLLLAVYTWAIWITRVGYEPLVALTAPILEFTPSNQIRTFVLPTFLTSIVGIGLGALVYARVRSVDIPWGLPARGRLCLTATTLFAVPVLVMITTLVGYVAYETPISSLINLRYAPEARLSSLVFSSFVPSILAGVGYGLAFYGVVHQRIREVTTPHHAIVLTPLLVGLFWEARAGVRHAFRWNPTLPDTVRILLMLVAAVAFASSLGLLYRGAFRTPVEHLLRARYVPVLAFGLFGAAVLLTSITDLPAALTDVVRLVVFGVAAYGYERTRSIWVPILVLAILPASLDLATWLDSTRPPY